MPPTILAATPVISSTQWSTALSPRTGGGWKFITQSYWYPNDVPTQWVLIDLEDGTVVLEDGPNRKYSNTNYQVASANTAVVATNQIRAANGRIFFPEQADSSLTALANVAVYDPADEHMHQIPAVVDPTGDIQTLVYKAVFGASGAMIYAGTQSAIGAAPMIFTIDPGTLATAYLCNVGVAPSTSPKYAYYIGKDEGPGANWLYVAVGQEHWEVVAINLNTNTPTVLTTTVGPGFQFVEFDELVNGWQCKVYSNGVLTNYWMADGALTAYPGSGSPPGGARNVIPYANPLVTPPQIDWSRGIGHTLWRPNGSSGAWTEITYDVTYKGPITLESLAVLQDGGTIIGNAEAYNGFFTYTNTPTWLGYWDGISRPVLCVIDATTVYMAGYANGVLYNYDPSAPWAPDGTVNGNPSLLGGYGTKVRYPYFLIRCLANDRLYACGREERDSSGSGMGYFNLGSQTFGPSVDAGLDDFLPRGFLVNEVLSLLVFSGEVIVGSLAPEALLITYDYDFTELHRWTVVPGLQNTGTLFPTSDPEIVCGLTDDVPALLYRFNIVTGVLVQSHSLGASVVRARVLKDGVIWVELDQILNTIDPDTLAIVPIVDLGVDATIFSWSAETLFMTVGAELRYLPGVGFTGTPVIERIINQTPAPGALVFRISGISLGAGASGSLSLADGAGDIALPDDVGIIPQYDASDPGVRSLAASIEIVVVPVDAGATPGVGSQTPAIVKTGTTSASFLATLTNLNGGGISSGQIEIWIRLFYPFAAAGSRRMILST